MKRFPLLVPAALVAALLPASASADSLTDLTTLRLLKDKGVISQAEYDSAMRDIADSSGARGGDDVTFTVSKFAATLYGFVEADAIWDSTQSLNDAAGSGLIARPAFTPAGAAMPTPATYAGSHSRLAFSIRNSRFGIRLKAPPLSWLRASGTLEMDFLGATLPVGSGEPYFGTEAAVFNNPTFRVRHAYLKLETPIVDLLMGQYWHPYGWGAQYFPNTVEIQGVPGEVFNRTTQIRVSHTFKFGTAAELELAVAAVRPPQRNAGVPEGVAGVRVAFPGWSGMQTINSTGTQIAPLSIAVSGDARQVKVAEWAARPVNSVSATGEAVSVEAFVPIIPATKQRKGNSLSLSGEFSYGVGIADLYTGLTGGVPIAPPLPNPMMANPAPTYTADIDPGIASFDANGVLTLAKWSSFNAGLQYYFPGLDGRLWISGNYSRTWSSNSSTLLGLPAGADAATTATARTKVRLHEDWGDVNLFGDPYPGVRFGLEYANFSDTYVDGVKAVNHRVQFSGFFIF